MEAVPSELIQLSSLELLLLSTGQSTLFFGFITLVLLLLCSALVSGSEIAYFSLTTNEINDIENEAEGGGSRVINLLEKPRFLLATILIANNFVNIAIVIISEIVLSAIFPESTFTEWGRQIINLLGISSSPEGVGQVINFLILTIGVTFLLVLFGEVVPKVYARMNNVSLARFMALPLQVMRRAFYPFSTLLVRTTGVVENRLSKRKAGSTTTREDIDEAIDLTVSSEENAQQEVDLLKSVVNFGDVSVKQVMKSRVDVVALDRETSYSELLNTVRDSGYSRIPVYENDFDKVVGILYVKDLISYLKEGDDFEWQKLIRNNLRFVPEAKKIDDLLREFQQTRMHMAIVVDEYGGSAGIITLEDILEEIIGDIKDEFDDEPEIVYQQIDERNFLFEGKSLLNDFSRIIGLDTRYFDKVRGESDSLAGLLLELRGTLPKKDATIEYNGFKFKIVSVNSRRIEKVLVTVPQRLSKPVDG